MIDIRQTYGELGISIRGKAEIIEGNEARKIVHKIHEKYLTHDALTDKSVITIFENGDDIAIRIKSSGYSSWDMGGLDDQVFGGAIKANNYLHDIEP